jgi:hypothetical protein
LLFFGVVGQDVAEKTVSHQIRINPAIRAGKKTVGLL